MVRAPNGIVYFMLTNSDCVIKSYLARAAAISSAWEQDDAAFALDVPHLSNVGLVSLRTLGPLLMFVPQVQWGLKSRDVVCL